MSTLILTLSPDTPGPAAEYSYTLTADGHTAIRHASATAALLPDPGRAGETVAVVPARLLSWHRVTLPQGTGGQAPRLRAVLEGLLEERLLDDTVLLHFALQPGARAGEPAWVAVCDRAWLRAALQTLEAAGRPVSRVVPEFAPGPTASGAAEFFAVGTPEDPQLVATGHGADQAVVMLPLTPASLDWLGASAQAAGDAAAPEPLRAEPAVATLAERLLGRPVELHTASQRALQAARGDWDLAQFDLASSGRTRALRKAGSAAGLLARAPQWRAARWAIGVLLVAQVVGLNVWAWQERRALAAKEAGVRSALTQTFPQVRAIVDAPVQMERELALLRQAAGSLSPADLEPVMAATGAALPDGQLPASLEYAGGELRLRGLDLDAAAIDTLNQRLMARGYLAREQNGLLQVRLEVQR
ncbi:type II secretion system protein GspL [Acidovorax sp. Leaf160]|uniref:type II secretion system protein GspL n=1 Tax=Acidovorax sp. Leaf160 TaxID=1736280 RepID=UPI0006F3C293|nr:type II secretion system protein GspL [Acidovorax sp. Leaf160]KQR63278.1 general secretion pathway protein GspL [Acidovorax sp. Leaf160]